MAHIRQEQDNVILSLQDSDLDTEYIGKSVQNTMQKELNLRMPCDTAFQTT